MANPQLENGYIKIANELFDGLIKTRLGGEMRQVFDFILRKTYGFNKKEDSISLSQFAEATNMKRTEVVRALNGLIKMNAVLKNENSYVNKYSIVKDFSKWKVFSKMRPQFSKMLQGVLKNENKSVLKIETYKRHKDNIQKTKEARVKPRDPKIKVLIDFFYEQYLKAFTIKPIVKGVVWAETFKRILKVYDIEIIKSSIIDYFKIKDKWLENQHYSVSAFEHWIESSAIKKIDKQKDKIIQNGIIADKEQQDRAREASNRQPSEPVSIMPQDKVAEQINKFRKEVLDKK